MSLAGWGREIRVSWCSVGKTGVGGRPWSFAVCSNSSQKRRGAVVSSPPGYDERLAASPSWSDLPGSQPACRVLSIEAESLSGVTLCLAIGYSTVIAICILFDGRRKQVVWREREREGLEGKPCWVGENAARHGFPPPETLSSPLRPLLPADGDRGWWRLCQSRTSPLRGKVAAHV